LIVLCRNAGCGTSPGLVPQTTCFFDWKGVPPAALNHLSIRKSKPRNLLIKDTHQTVGVENEKPGLSRRMAPHTAVRTRAIETHRRAPKRT